MRTRWAVRVSQRNPLPEYPRPQFVRKEWKSLNGAWEYGLTELKATQPSGYPEKILVPYPYESALSGKPKPSIPDRKLWYRRTFTLPAKWKGQRVRLNFGAVNYLADVTVNGHAIGSHRGGYDAFSFDISDALRPGANEIIVAVQNPLRADVPDAQVLGKQRVKSGGIMYTAATGIWQSVWLEPVPAAAIQNLTLTPDIDRSMLHLTVNGPEGERVQVTAMDGAKVIATVSGFANAKLGLPVPNAKLWSPESPHLYQLKVQMGHDEVESYFAMRKIALRKGADGRQQIELNNRPYFQVGALDQGYWPDGIYTAPTDAALKFDIEAAKELGFNMLRKHAKVEPMRWYYHADRLGVLVWQDMPQMFGEPLTDDAKQQFDVEWKRLIEQLTNTPSIVVWTTFNEGWGQHDTERVVARTRELDPTRLVNNASGWVDKNVGDMHDTHAYPGPGSELPNETRAAVNGEFGGVTLSVPGHRWTEGDVMGYGTTLNSKWKATQNFQNLMRAVYALKAEKGTCAFVYTQLTDVEQEINGLLTYDRTVTKLDPRIVAAANRGEFLPMPPNRDPKPKPPIVPVSDDQGIEWFFTTEAPSNSWNTDAFVPTGWQTGLAPFGRNVEGVRTAWTSSDIWIRRDFKFPARAPATLKLLVKHDEDAEIYINGVLAAKVTGYNNEYAAVPMSPEARAALRPGRNTLAVHCHQTIGGQGIDVGIAKG